MSDSHPTADRSRRLDSRRILAVVAGVLLLWFAAANWHSVTIQFWVSSAKAPLFVVIMLAAVLGGFVTWLARRHRGAPPGE